MKKITLLLALLLSMTAHAAPITDNADSTTSGYGTSVTPQAAAKSSPGNFGGMFVTSYMTTSPATVTCKLKNKVTNACSCPSGTSAVSIDDSQSNFALAGAAGTITNTAICY